MLGRFVASQIFGAKNHLFWKAMFVRNSGRMFHLNIPGFVGIPKNFGTWTISSRLPLDAKLLGTVIFPPSISLLDFCSTCFVVGPIPNWDVYQIMAFHNINKQVCWKKQSFVTLENSWTRSWNRHHSRPFQSILFQQLKIPIRWTSTWTILNLSPPKLSYVLPSQTPFSFLELSKKSEEKFIPKVLPPNWSNRLYIYKGCPKMFDNPSFFPRGNFDRALFFSVWKSRAARPFSSRSRQYSWQFWTGFKIIFCTDWKISASCLYLIWTLI